MIRIPQERESLQPFEPTSMDLGQYRAGSHRSTQLISGLELKGGACECAISRHWGGADE